MHGDSSKVTNFEWDPEYQDFTNRFEGFVDIENIKTPQDLYDKLHDWLGITKKGRLLPTQKQMDFFSEYYGTQYYDIKEYEKEERAEQEDVVTFEYKSGGMYNVYNKVFAKRLPDRTYEAHEVEEVTYHLKYGNRTVLRDRKTKRILSHHYDETNKQYLGSRV